MKITATGALCLLSIAASGQWNDVNIQQQGREATRTQFVSYDSRDAAATYDPGRSSFFIPLDGEWMFTEAAGDSTTEKRVTLPSYWTTASPEELSALKPPALPADNPAGQYHRDADIPGSWLDREIYLHVGGARSAVTVYVNGIKVGYCTDGSTPAEFNISRYVAAGSGNTISLEVYKWSEGSWLEGSSISGAGIAGEVYIYSQPRVRIADFIIDASLDSLNKTGKLALDIITANSFNTDEEISVHFDLEDSKGDIIKFNDRAIAIPANGVDTVRFTADIPNVATWSAGAPNIYRLMMRIRQNGRFTEYIPYKIGFRRLENRDGVTYINGSPIEIKGTVIIYKGTAPDAKTMRSELMAVMKAYNTIECLYHPAKDRLYNMCLELGIYVIDRPAIDPMLIGRGIQLGGSISNDPQWTGAYIFRGENAYYSGRNHSSLIRWSLGGMESAGMYNIYRLDNRLRELDNSGRY